MATCLRDQDLAAYVSGSVTPEQLKAWMSHIAKGDTGSQKVASQDVQPQDAPEPPKISHLGPDLPPAHAPATSRSRNALAPAAWASPTRHAGSR